MIVFWWVQPTRMNAVAVTCKSQQHFAITTTLDCWYGFMYTWICPLWQTFSLLSGFTRPRYLYTLHWSCYGLVFTTAFLFFAEMFWSKHHAVLAEQLCCLCTKMIFDYQQPVYQFEWLPPLTAVWWGVYGLRPAVHWIYSLSPLLYKQQTLLRRTPVMLDISIQAEWNETGTITIK